ncbi:MAG: hypothetical protein Q8J78_13020 [Moraxellaceae bacterium]|nr:hypothetical protein [Moraxellaceae bacterium]
MNIRSLNHRQTVLALGLVALMGSTASFANDGREKREGRHGGKPGSFTTEVVTTTDDGKVFKRRIEQKVADGKLERRTQVTRPDGKTASQVLIATRDGDKGVTRKVEGTDFDGKPYVRESTHRREGEGRAPHAGKWREHARADKASADGGAR